VSNPAAFLPWLRPPAGPVPADPIAEAHAQGVAVAEARARRTLTEIRLTAAARGRLRDPDDAAAFYDLNGIDPDDPAAISVAIDALIAERPYLGVPPPPIKDENTWLRRGWAAGVSPWARRLLGR
jgi:hypothetical protein